MGALVLADLAIPHPLGGESAAWWSGFVTGIGLFLHGVCVWAFTSASGAAGWTTRSRAVVALIIAWLPLVGFLVVEHRVRHRLEDLIRFPDRRVGGL